MPQSKAPTNPLKPPTSSPEGERGQTPVQGYVHTVHDFCHDSANQASLLALAAPKIQSSRGGVLSTLLNSQTPLKMGQEAGYSYLSLITSPFSLGKAPTLLNGPGTWYFLAIIIHFCVEIEKSMEKSQKSIIFSCQNTLYLQIERKCRIISDNININHITNNLKPKLMSKNGKT